jgi:hypothetical protein
MTESHADRTDRELRLRGREFPSDRAGIATLLFLFAAVIVVGIALSFLGRGPDQMSIATNDTGTRPVSTIPSGH